MMAMSSLIFEEDGGVMTRKSYDGLKRPSPRGKSGDETVKYMCSKTCSNSTPYHILAIVRNRADIPLISTFVSIALPAVVLSG